MQLKNWVYLRRLCVAFFALNPAPLCAAAPPSQEIG